MDVDMSLNSSDAQRRLSQGQEKKGPWSNEEDERLKEAVGSSSPRPKWAEIANKVEGRSAKQCRERWEQNLSPRLNKHPISHAEAAFIIHFVDEQGKKWAEISRQLSNRSDNNIKNWYNGMVQKGKTGRGPQEEPLRRHFSPENQNYLNNRGRKSAHRSPHMDHQQAMHYASYPPQQSGAYMGRMTAPYPSVGTGSWNTAPQQPVYTQGPPLSSYGQLPPPPSSQSLQLPPLQTSQPPRSVDYFSQGYHSRSLEVPAISPDGGHYYRRSADVSPSSSRREGSYEMPGLSGSTSSTPMQGSPLTPVSHHADIYRHRENSNDSNSMDIDRESARSQADPSKSPAEQPGSSQRVSVNSMLN